MRDFGRRLIQTEDLDPVYVGVYGLGLDAPTRARWLLAYWCFYHCGVACALSGRSGPDFYAGMRQADAERWPRGRERRHFRGKTSQATIEWLSVRFPRPEDGIASLESAGRFEELSRRVRAWPAFGPWIAFKAADMLERLGVAEIAFSEDVLAFYSEPVAGARLAEGELGVRGLRAVVEELTATYSDLPAPPRGERRVGVQEVETVLCKWKSHLNGRYPIGLDTREIAHGLSGWGSLAEEMKRCLPSPS